MRLQFNVRGGVRNDVIAGRVDGGSGHGKADAFNGGLARGAGGDDDGQTFDTENRAELTASLRRHRGGGLVARAES